MLAILEAEERRERAHAENQARQLQDEERMQYMFMSLMQQMLQGEDRDIHEVHSTHFPLYMKLATLHLHITFCLPVSSALI